MMFAVENKVLRSKLEALYEAHYTRLYDYGYGICKDETITKDSIQEVFLQLCEKPTLINTIRHDRSYLMTSLRRAILKKVAIKRRRSGLEESGVADIAIPSYEEHLINAQEDTDKKEQLRQTFSLLSLAQKNILTMRFYKGMSYEDIADQLGITKRTVYNQIHTAVKKLRHNI